LRVFAVLGRSVKHALSSCAEIIEIGKRAAREIKPEDAGLILADGFGAEILRQAPEHCIAAA
jgi:hypothetical protein